MGFPHAHLLPICKYNFTQSWNKVTYMYIYVCVCVNIRFYLSILLYVLQKH